MSRYRAGDLVRVVFPFEVPGDALAAEGHVIGVLSDRRVRIVFPNETFVAACLVEQAVMRPYPDAIRLVAADSARGDEPPGDLAEAVRLRQLFAAQGEAVIAVDRDDRIQFWNEAAELLYGWTAYQAIHESFAVLMVPEVSMGQSAAIIREAAAGRVWAGDFIVRRRDGTRFLAQCADYPVFNDDGALVGVVGISSPAPDPRDTALRGYRVGDPARVQFPFTSSGEPVTAEGLVTNRLSESLFRVVFQDVQGVADCTIEQALVDADLFT